MGGFRGQYSSVSQYPFACVNPTPIQAHESPPWTGRCAHLWAGGVCCLISLNLTWHMCNCAEGTRNVPTHWSTETLKPISRTTVRTTVRQPHLSSENAHDANHSKPRLHTPGGKIPSRVLDSCYSSCQSHRPTNNSPGGCRAFWSWLWSIRISSPRATGMTVAEVCTWILWSGGISTFILRQPLSPCFQIKPSKHASKSSNMETHNHFSSDFRSARKQWKLTGPP